MSFDGTFNAEAAYDAFLSYAHRDRPVATAIQKGLHQIGRRLGQLRALRVFRDDTNLTASPDLWGRITDALDSSRFMIVVLSPQSAASHWVNEEISYWLAHRGHDQLMLVLAEGQLLWDDARQRFDPDQSDAAPAALTQAGSLPVEPLYIDVSDDAPWDLRSSLFRDKVTALAAPVHGKAKDQLSGDDMREQRRFRRLRAAAVTALALLTILTTVAALIAVNKQHQADARLRDAVVAKLNAEAAAMLAGLTPGGDERALQELLAANAIEGNGVPILNAQIARFTTQKIVDTGSRPGRPSYSPDGRRIATGQSDGTVRQWDSVTGRQFGDPLKPQTSQVFDVAYATDGRAIASVGVDGFRLLNATSGAILNAPAGSGRLHNCVAVNPDGKTFVSGDPRNNNVEVRDTGDGRLLNSFPAQINPDTAGVNGDTGISDVAYNRDGTLIAVSSFDGLVGIYDGATGAPQPPLMHITSRRGSRAQAHQVAFSPDGHTLAVAVDDLQLWNVDTKTLTRRIQVDPSPFTINVSVAFSPDGLRVATGRVDGAVQLWDPDTGAPLGTTMTGHTGQVLGIAFSPHGRQLATTSVDGTLRLWSGDVGQAMGRIEPLSRVAFSPDNQRLAASGDTMLQQWDLGSGLPRLPDSLSALPQYNWFAFTTGGQVVVARSDGAVATLDPETGEAVRPPIDLPIPAGGVSMRYAVSSDGRTLAWGSTEDRAVHLSDVTTGREIGHPMIATPLAGVKNPPDPVVTAITFSPDDHHLIAGYADGVRLWNTDTTEPDGQVMSDPGPPNYVTDVAVSHDGTTIAAGRADGVIELWDLSTRRQVPHSPLRGHTGMILHLAFGAGHQLASISPDGTMRLWDAASGAPTAAPVTRSGTATDVALSPDGRLVALVTLSGSALLLPALADPGQLCDKLTANISHDHWRDWISPGIDYITVCPKLPPAQER